MQFNMSLKCPALPLPLVQIPDPRALPNVQCPTPGKRLLPIAEGMLKFRIDRYIIWRVFKPFRGLSTLDNQSE